MSKYKDFDSLNGDPLQFTIGGKNYEIPSDLSPEFVLGMMGEDKPENDMAIFFAIISETLGEEAHAEIKKNAGWKAYEALVKWVISEILNVDTDKDTEEGKGEESETPSTSPSPESSSTGPSLKPISGGFGLVDPQTIDVAVG